MPVSHKLIIKISVKGFLKTVELYHYHLCYYGSGDKRELELK